jgi:putative heme-binding domain-containing protein
MLREVIAKVVKDTSPGVRREAAIALRFDESEQGKQNSGGTFARSKSCSRSLAILKPLGLAQTRIGTSWSIPMSKLLLKESSLRQLSLPFFGAAEPSHTSNAAPVWAMLIASDEGESIRGNGITPLGLLRSLQLLSYKHPAEVSAAALTIFLKADAETALASTALLDRNAITSNPEAKARLDSLLKPVVGKPEFVALVEKLNLTGFEKELLDFISANPNAPESVNAARLIAANRDGALRFLKDADAKSAKALIAALGRVSDRAAVAVMNQHFWPEKREDVRRVLIDALALSGEGGRAILKWQSEGKLPPQFKDQAALALSRSTDAGLRDQAARELPLPAAQGLANFPKLPELMKLKGDAAKGQAMFMQAGCVACHRVKGQFIDFGPDLTQIGAKLSQDGLFTAILYPSAAIEHSFVGQNVTTKEGQAVMGYVVSETDAELTLRMAGGASTTVKKVNIVKKEELKDSLMPPGLAVRLGRKASRTSWRGCRR